MSHRLENPPPRPTPPDLGPDALDPQLHPLLDEALGPPFAPAGLEERILGQTASRLPRGHVLARIGGRTLAAAAVVVLAAGVGVVMWAASQPEPNPAGTGTVATTTPSPTPGPDGATPSETGDGADDAHLAALTAELEALDAIARDLDDGDTRLDLLALQVAAVPEDVWADSPDDLPEAMRQSELDLLYMGETLGETGVF